jgi:hypothetical protein
MRAEAQRLKAKRQQTLARKAAEREARIAKRRLSSSTTVVAKN